VSYGVNNSTVADPFELHRNLDLASLRSVLEGVNRDAEAPNRRKKGRTRGRRNLISSWSLPYGCLAATAGRQDLS